MSRDGPEKQTIIARLKAKSAQETRDLEDEIQRQHAQLAANLRTSSSAALKQIETSITDQMSRIETEIRGRRNALNAEMAEIQSEPARLMRRSALIGAVIGGLIAMIPWGAMTYLGISVTGEARSYFERAAVMRQEEERINAMAGIEVIEISGARYLTLPRSVDQIWSCGNDLQTPCIKLEE